MLAHRLLPRLAALLTLAVVTTPLASAQVLLADADTLAGRFDQGRMWTFDTPPSAYFSDAYAFDADAEWFERARLAALRLPGCSAGFVSARGLVLTNHHCVRGYLARVAEDGETLLDDGFYAQTLREERRIPDVYVDQLVALDDVTLEMDELLALPEAESANEVAQGLGEQLTAALEDDRLHVQVVSLYQGARYSAYTFRRYDDVRLVFAPELQLGYYGGDADNYVFPRYALDMGLLRVYGEDGEPVRTDDFFGWSLEGTGEGEPVFVIGNPGATFRLETVSQLETRRDVTDDALYGWITRYADAIDTALPGLDPGSRDGYRNLLFGLRNNDKRYGGRLRALRDRNVMARRMDGEKRLREGLALDGIAPEFLAAFAEMEAIQSERRELAEPTRAFTQLTNARYSSATLRRAISVFRALRSDGMTDSARAALVQRAADVSALPAPIERAFLVARIAMIAEAYGTDAPLTRSMLRGRTPEALADAILAESAFASPSATEGALADGAIPEADPALDFVAAFHPALVAYEAEVERLVADEQRLERTVGQARLAVYGPDAPPDGTFSLRVADGVVQGYGYNGTRAAPFTTFSGLYDKHYSFQADEPGAPASEWSLPGRWANPPATFERATPFNFVATANTTGGNSGSPVVNRNLELVGLNFDRNIEGLTADFLFYEEGPLRNVMVDARGMLEALDEIYRADRIVIELAEGVFIESDAEAERRRD